MGKFLLEAKGEKEQAAILKEWLKPLVQQLIEWKGDDIDLTRINIATTNFQDKNRKPLLGEASSEASSQMDYGTKRKSQRSFSSTSSKVAKTSTPTCAGHASLVKSPPSGRVGTQQHKTKMKATRIDQFFVKTTR